MKKAILGILMLLVCGVAQAVPIVLYDNTGIELGTATNPVKVSFSGTQSITGDLSVSGTMTVGGTMTASGDVEVDGALYVDGFLYGNGSQLTGISAGSENWTNSGSDIYTYGNVGINTTDADDILNVLAEGTGGITVDAVTASQTLVAQGTGTAIGDLTAAGGLAASFDGVKLSGSGSQKTGTSGYIGKDWGFGNTKTITGFNAYSQIWGFVNGYSGAATLTLQGSTDNFSSSVVTLGVLSITDLQTYQTETKTTGIDLSTAYRYHRILINASGNPSTEYGTSEVEFLEGGGIANPSVTFDSLGTTYGAVGLDASSNVTISNNTGVVVSVGQSGNVGIGTTSPTAELDVGGGSRTYTDGVDDVLVKDDLEVDGDIYGGSSVVFTNLPTSDPGQAGKLYVTPGGTLMLSGG